MAGLVGDEVVTGGQDSPAGLALVDHPALPGLTTSLARVGLQQGLEDFFRNYLGSSQVFTDCLQFVHFVTQKVLLQFKSHCFPQPQLSHKSGVWVHTFSFRPQNLQTPLHRIFMFLHQEGHHHGGRPGPPVLGVDQGGSWGPAGRAEEVYHRGELAQ